MKRVVLLLLMFSLFSFSKKKLSSEYKSIYDFKVSSLEGGNIDFASFKGKKILIVNTASKCGLTPQYAELEQLHNLYGDKVVLIGFPANNFLFQEPGSNQDIKEFCTKNYGVSFLMAEKISVKGKDMHPLYIWLTQKRYNHFSDNDVQWNFQKYLIDENGKLIAVFSPKTLPLSPEITEKL